MIGEFSVGSKANIYDHTQEAMIPLPLPTDAHELVTSRAMMGKSLNGFPAIKCTQKPYQYIPNLFVCLDN